MTKSGIVPCLILQAQTTNLLLFWSSIPTYNQKLEHDLWCSEYLQEIAKFCSNSIISWQVNSYKIFTESFRLSIYHISALWLKVYASVFRRRHISLKQTNAMLIQF